MRASLPCRTLCALALTAAMALPAGAGSSSPAGAATGLASSPAAAPLSQAWSWLRAIWLDAGCGMDPNGRSCGSVAPLPRPEEGCGMDPNGRGCGNIAPPPRPDAGCGMDPDGRCLQNPRISSRQGKPTSRR
jgi:hypothetical protein